MFSKQTFKKLLFLIFLIIILIFLINHFISYFYKPSLCRKNFIKNLEIISENNKNSIFKLKNIQLFSDINVENTSAFSNNWNINLNQFTDIAIYIEKNTNEKENLKSTIKSIYIDNINISKPDKGIPNFYYKSPLNYGKYILNENNLIEQSLEFQIVKKSDEEDNNIDLSLPYFYNDCTNPITLSFINKNIVNNYSVNSNVQNIIFNGHILKDIGITISEISCKCSFFLNIVNYLDEHYRFLVSFDIPLQTDTNSITDGKINKTIEIDKFFYHLN